MTPFGGEPCPQTWGVVDSSCFVIFSKISDYSTVSISSRVARSYRAEISGTHYKKQEKHAGFFLLTKTRSVVHLATLIPCGGGLEAKGKTSRLNWEIPFSQKHVSCDSNEKGEKNQESPTVWPFPHFSKLRSGRKKNCLSDFVNCKKKTVPFCPRSACRNVVVLLLLLLSTPAGTFKLMSITNSALSM